MRTLENLGVDTEDSRQSLLDQTFVGRQAQLEMLSRELTAAQARAVCIVGSVGIGKTALALRFGRLHRDFFTGGIHHVSAMPYKSIRSAVDAEVGHRSSPHLLVLDDLDHLPNGDLRLDLQGVRHDRPTTRVICISQQQDLADVVDLTIQLSGLEREESYGLLVRAAGLLKMAASKNDFLNALTGNALATGLSADLSQSKILSPRGVVQLLCGFMQSGIVDLNGSPIHPGAPESQRIIVDLRSVNDRLLEHVHDNPGLLYELSSRRFEELVAELLSRLGYSITLTPRSKDGGKDIYAAKKDALGSFLFVVECKRYAAPNSIGVGLVRQLNGVVEAERATAGILVTTSFFTRGAQEFQKTVPHRMSLKDYFGIQEWLREALGR